MKESIKIGFSQSEIESDPFDDSVVKVNFDRVCSLIDEACEEEHDLLILPDEIIGGYSYGPMNIPLEFENEYLDKLKEKAKKYSVYIAGAVLARQDYITSFSKGFLISREGEVVFTQNRNNVLKEEERFVIRNNDEIKVFDTDFGTVAFCIGIDILFPEIFCQLIDKKVDIIISPNMFYGKDAEDNPIYPATFFMNAALSRAMENQIIILMSNSTGVDYHSEESLVGNSMVVCPDGTFFIAKTGEKVFSHNIIFNRELPNSTDTYNLKGLRSK